MFKKPLKLLPTRKEKAAVAAKNFSRTEINEMFDLKWYEFSLFYAKRAKRLFNLGLSFDNCKYLLQTIKLSVDEIERLFNLGLSFNNCKYLLQDKNLSVNEIKSLFNLGLNIDLIRNLNCTRENLLNEVPQLIQRVGGINNFRDIISYGSINEFWELFFVRNLPFKNASDLFKCGYSVFKINKLLVNFLTEDLVSLANIITPNEVGILSTTNLRFLLSVKNLVNTEVVNEHTALEVYQSFYNIIPGGVATSLVNNATALLLASAPGDEYSTIGQLTYEELLTYFMRLASGEYLDFLEKIDFVTPQIFKIAVRVIRFFKPDFEEFFDNYIPIRPFVLASIWVALEMSIELKYIKSTKEQSSEVICRSILAFLLSSLCGATGYFHTGGAGLPFPNISDFCRKYFERQQWVRKYAPKIYQKLPKALLLKTPNAFVYMTEEYKINTGKALAMIYTFRVGNEFLCSILGESIFTFDMARNLFGSLLPIPRETESIRTYFIYSGIPIYTTLDLQQVFVKIDNDAIGGA